MAVMPTLSCRSQSCGVLIPIHSIRSSRKWNYPHTYSEIGASKKWFDKFNSKCSLADTSMADDIVTVIKKQEQPSAGTSKCPVNIILSSEKDNVVDAPVYPTALFLLYANCLAGNIVEQLWNFTWPAAIAMIHPTILPVAIIGFVTKITVIFGGPLVGKLMDFFPRVPAYNSISFVQVVAQLCSVALIIYAHTAASATPSSTFFHPWFIALVVASSIERLSGLVLGVSMERDWVVLLAGIDRPVALAEANAVLSRIDLLCEIAGSFLFGILLSKYDPVTCLKLASHLMLWSLPVVAFLTWLTNKLSHGILGRPRPVQTFSEAYKDIHAGVRSVKDGWLEYIQQPVLPASIAYVLLYFNIALSPGGLMTTFLTQRGLNPLFIGTFGGLCASMGIAATFISANLVRRLGIVKAGAAGLIFQASLLTIAGAVYCSGSVSQNIPLFFFLSSIVLSRLGHMSYDVVGTQILQTGIPPSKANLIGVTEVSVSSFAELLMLGVAIFAKADSHFGLLIFLSLISVIGSAVLFCRWLTNPTDEQRTLFFDPRF